MKNKNLLPILILAFIVLIGGASLLYKRFGSEMAPDQLLVESETKVPEAVEESGEVPREEEEEAPMQAPDFTAYDADGNEVHLSDYLGKPVVLNFWASWCGPCKIEMPDFQEKYLEIGEDVQFLMVNMTDGFRETVKSASGMVEKEGYTFPVFFDSESDAATTYGVYSIPTTFFIDAEGYAIARATGAINMETLERGIEMIWEVEE